MNLPRSMLGALTTAIAIGASSLAAAQTQAPPKSPATGVEQIGQAPNARSDVSLVGQASESGVRDALKVSQLGGGLRERPATTSNLKPSRATSALDVQLAQPSRSRRDSLDPEEIARVLNRGEANSIDAASAIASTLLAQPEPEPPEPDAEPGDEGE